MRFFFMEYDSNMTITKRGNPQLQMLHLDRPRPPPPRRLRLRRRDGLRERFTLGTTAVR